MFLEVLFYSRLYFEESSGSLRVGGHPALRCTRGEKGRLRWTAPELSTDSAE